MKEQWESKAGRIIYGLGMAAIAVQEMFFGQFARILFPTWKENIPGFAIITAIGSVLLLLAGLAIAFLKQPRPVALWLGGILFILFVFSYVPYNLFFQPGPKMFGIWGNALKELALSGGALLIAGNFSADAGGSSGPLRLFAGLIPAGPVFFVITMVSFGIMHFMYPDFVGTLVPVWVGHPVFWTYAAGVLLILSGLAIGLNLLRRFAALALALMLALWVLMLHIPRALADPYGDRGNEVVAVFTAIAFTGIALAIAAGRPAPAR